MKLLCDQYATISKRDKKRAVNLLNSAVKSGEVVRPSQCSWCGKGGRIEGHHFDYTKPLAVTWVCKACHAIHHAAVRMRRERLSRRRVA